MQRSVYLAIVSMFGAVLPSLAEDAGDKAAERSRQVVVVGIQLISVDRTLLAKHPGEIGDDGRLLRLEQAVNDAGAGAAAKSRGTESSRFTSFTDGDAVGRLLDQWCQSYQAATVLAAPTMAVVEGQAASLHVGGEIKVAVPATRGRVQWESRKIGTLCDCRATIEKNDRVTLDLFARHHRLDPDRKQSVTINGHTLPAIQTLFDVNLNATLRSGQCMLLSGLRQARRVGDGHHEFESLLIVKATIAPPEGAKP